jgi:hypothetical protein
VKWRHNVADLGTRGGRPEQRVGFASSPTTPARYSLGQAWETIQATRYGNVIAVLLPASSALGMENV